MGIIFPLDMVDVYQPVDGGVDRFGNPTGDLQWTLVASNVPCDIQPLNRFRDGDKVSALGINDEAILTVLVGNRPYIGKRYKLVVTKQGSDSSGEGLVGQELGVYARDRYTKIMPHQKLWCGSNHVL